MKVRRRSIRRWGIRLIAVGLMLIGLFILVDMRIRPIIEKTSSYQSRITATRLINTAVYQELSSEDYDYSSLVRLSTAQGGGVTSVESNMVTINRLKTKITQDVNEAIKAIEAHDLGISLGTASGVHMLYGKGPLIPIRVTPKGYANAALISEFSSAGINQTLHRIVLRITADLSAIIPGYTTSVEIDTDFVIAETVIVGNVPSAYTHIITGEPDLINSVADYGAGD